MVLAHKERSEADGCNVNEPAQPHEILLVGRVDLRTIEDLGIYTYVEYIHPMLLDGRVIVGLSNTVDGWDVIADVVL